MFLLKVQCISVCLFIFNISNSRMDFDVLFFMRNNLLKIYFLMRNNI